MNTAKCTEGKPRAIHRFPSLSKQGDFNADTHMFIEDVKLGVMPIDSRVVNRELFSASIEGDNEEIERTTELFNSFARNYHHDEVDLVCGVINKLAADISVNGQAVYEIVRDQNDPKNITLHWFTTKRLLRIPIYYVQLIPEADFDYCKKRIVWLPARNVWKIRIPKSLGGESGYSKILYHLKKYPSTGPSFYFDDMQTQKVEETFDFIKYRFNKDAHITRITKRWGWTRRDGTQKYDTEFFYFYRALTFHWTQAILREHIIDELNCLLSRLKINSKIVVTGLSSPDGILSIRNDLIKGEITFNDAYNRVRY